MWESKYDVIKAGIVSAVYTRAVSRYLILSFLPPQNNYVGIKYDVIKAVVGRCAIYICGVCMYVMHVSM